MQAKLTPSILVSLECCSVKKMHNYFKLQLHVQIPVFTSHTHIYKSHMVVVKAKSCKNGVTPVVRGMQSAKKKREKF